MRYWKNIVNEKQGDEWWPSIINILTQCKNYLNKLDYDFILLQETIPLKLDNYITYSCYAKTMNMI